MRIATISIVIALCLSISACDGITHIRGKVSDVNGKPIEGAYISLKLVTEGRKDESKSGADGTFSVGLTHAPSNIELLLTVSKAGYKTVETRFTSREASLRGNDSPQRPLLITLESVREGDSGKQATDQRK